MPEESEKRSICDPDVFAEKIPPRLKKTGRAKRGESDGRAP
jgi:hypothetical protein